MVKSSQSRTSPFHIPGLQIWNNSGKQLTINTTTSDTVSNWNSVTFVRGFSQSTKANQPSYVYDQVGGATAATYDGTNDYLGAQFVPSSFGNSITGVSAFYVIKCPTGTTTYPWVMSRNAALNIGFTVRTNGTNSFQIGGRRLDGDGYFSANTANNIYVSNTWFVMVAIGSYESATAKIWINGKNAVNATGWGTAGRTQATNVAEINLGQHNSGGFWSGSMVEFAAWSRDIGDVNALKLTQYARSKYGIN